MKIEDLNFGVRTWYLKPTVIVKLLTALMTFVLLVYLFVMAGRFSDVLWKAVIGKSHLFLILFMVIAMITVGLSFLFSFYKIFPDHTSICLFVSIGAGAVYVLEYVILCIGYISEGRCDAYTRTIAEHIKGSTADEATLWFLAKYKLTQDSELIPEKVKEYVEARTVGAKGLLSAFSMIWIVLYVMLIFVFLFESKPEQARPQDLKPDVET